MLTTLKQQQHLVTKNGGVGACGWYTDKTCGTSSMSGFAVPGSFGMKTVPCVVCESMAYTSTEPCEVRGGMKAEGFLALFYHFSHQYEGEERPILKGTRQDCSYYERDLNIFHSSYTVSVAARSDSDLGRKIIARVFDGTVMERFVRLDREDGRPGIWTSYSRDDREGVVNAQIGRNLYLCYLPLVDHDCLVHRARFSGDYGKEQFFLDDPDDERSVAYVPPTDSSFLKDAVGEVLAMYGITIESLSLAGVCGASMPEEEVEVVCDEVDIEDVEEIVHDVVVPNESIFSDLAELRKALEGDPVPEEYLIPKGQGNSSEDDLYGSYSAVIACSPVDDKAWGYCYEEIFDEKDRGAVRSYVDARSHLTRDHYHWINQQSFRFVDKVHCLVYVVQDNDSTKLVHSALVVDARAVWKLLDRIIDWMFPVEVYVHFTPLEIDPGIVIRPNPFFLDGGWRELLRLRQRWKGVFWMTGNNANVTHLSRLRSFVCVTRYVGTKVRMRSLGVPLSRITTLAGSANFREDFVIYMTDCHVDLNVYDDFCYLAAFHPDSTIIVCDNTTNRETFVQELRLAGVGNVEFRNGYANFSNTQGLHSIGSTICISDEEYMCVSIRL